MMRSLFSGVSGLKTHQTRMDVIGNNIANVNTTAYKSSSMVFSELISQTTQKASGPNATTGAGGINARQIGLGVRSGAINMNITGQGAAQSTGNPFDIMISGSSFFVVSDGSNNFFTRDGSFYVDGAGNLAMTSNGYNVMGWQVDEETMTIKQDTVSALRIMSAANMTYPPEATSKAYFAGLVDKNNKDIASTSGKSVNLNFYDNLGYAYTAKFVLKQSSLDDKSEYSIELDKILDSAGNVVDLSKAAGAAEALFGNSGVEQQQNRTISLDESLYKWVGTKLYNKTDDPTATPAPDPLVDLNALFNGDGTLKNDAPQAQLDTLAKAYGYEGSTDDFLALTLSVTATETGGTASFTVNNPYTIGKIFANQLTNTSPYFGDANVAEPANFGLTSFDATGRTFDGITVKYDPDNGEFYGVGGVINNNTAKLRLSQLGGNFFDIDIDFSKTSMFDNNGTCTVGATAGDFDGLGMGRKLGDMSGVSIQQNGMIYASYDNGMTRLLGQIAVAEFANASGLERAGENLYSATLNSGEFDGIGVDITANGGKMSTGQLEMSNVDLSSEFTEMITTQRGFQANSRIITVSDTLLEELTNLKR